MPKVIIQSVDANYESDMEKVVKGERILDVDYWSKDDIFCLTVNIGADDHFITLNIDRKALMQSIEEALVHPETE